MTIANSAQHSGEPLPRARVSLDELAHRRGAQPVTAVEDMAEDGVFTSDEEVEAFLAHVHASRHSDLG